VDIRIDPLAVVTVVLAATRFVVFFLVAPPFSSPAVPARVKVGLSLTLALATVGRIDAPDDMMLELVPLILAVGYQVLVGAALGFVVNLIFSAVQSAGALVDYSAAFSSGVLYDPFAGAGLSPMARLYQLLATSLLFTSGGYLLFVAGIVRSFEAAPLSGLSLGGLGELLTDRLGSMVIAAIQIALPLLVALFMAELVLGLMARAAPQLNLLVVGFGVKSAIVLGLGVVALPLLPHAVNLLVAAATRSMGLAVG
jgi:flagellar biosynthetic protein FliR